MIHSLSIHPIFFRVTMLLLLGRALYFGGESSKLSNSCSFLYCRTTASTWFVVTPSRFATVAMERRGAASGAGYLHPYQRYKISARSRALACFMAVFNVLIIV
jgi:hypothetical protein